jgi:hypothetical protein
MMKVQKILALKTEGVFDGNSKGPGENVDNPGKSDWMFKECDVRRQLIASVVRKSCLG